MDRGPSVLSLCAGIGGLDLGIELALPGARTVCFVEREAACIELLAARMEEGRLAPAPVWSDLKTFDGTAWRGKVDLVAAGYPCQPFSVAGKGLAEKDERHLWPDVARIIEEVYPTVVVLENVQGHVRRGLEQVLRDLEGMGFNAEWGVYAASSAGAPHRRNRVFILAYTERQFLREQSRRGRGENRPDSVQPSVVSEAVAWPPGPEGDWSQVPEYLWPATEPNLRGVVDGVPVELDQLRALGNAVVPQQCALALRDLIGRIL